ncbi:hypothetical protein [Sebaldella sp. S0638]|uniref:hypothetical protein n=1 Tax=Sebaldella sp. S0638 TaxID=2957809 RepID=UPI0020A06CA0|nr:hypothetical protein [Sebaldella sp. S0638]MCP1226415.1 hypothetical protein [Sebaldella sp. S0638]
MKLSKELGEIIEETVFQNEKMKDLSAKILELETKFKKKYSPEILKDYFEITELMLEELLLGSELHFEYGFEFIKEYLFNKTVKS